MLSGAGMSADSGVPTFRDAQTGLWARYRAEDLATPEAWQRDPAFVWAWYVWRFETVRQVRPNAGHVAVAEWSRLDGVSLRVVTQNIDDLHERAGSPQVEHLHGSIAAFRCDTCGAPYPGEVSLPTEPVEHLDPPSCPHCTGLIRPGVVWFGEALPQAAWAAAEQAVSEADLLLVVGTSGLVYPAAGLPAMGRGHGATVLEVNPSDTDVSDVAHHVWRETAARALPALVRQLRRTAR